MIPSGMTEHINIGSIIYKSDVISIHMQYFIYTAHQCVAVTWANYCHYVHVKFDFEEIKGFF